MKTEIVMEKNPAIKPAGMPGDKESPWRDLTPLMRPKNVAVVGVSQKRGTRANMVISNLVNLGFPGRIFPINPKYSEVSGLPCFPDLAAVAEPIDCVVLAIPARHINEILKSAVGMGISAAIILSSGFAEAGPEGQKRQAELETLSRDRNLRICGPNCYGLFNVLEKAPLLSSSIQPGFLSGEVAVVSQSGGLGIGIANALVQNHGVGLSYVVSCGNQAGVTVEDYMNYFVEDDHTRVIAAFVEGFKQPEKLLRVARKALARSKPIIILKVGKSEASKRATMAHSGSLAGAAEVIEAAFRQTGIVQVHTLNEMIETVTLFSCRPFMDRFRGEGRIGILSGSGGECGLAADVIAELGLKLPDLADATKSHLREALPDFGTPQNPLDGTGAIYENEKIFPDLLRTFIRDPNLDLVAIKISANSSKSSSSRSSHKRLAEEIAKAASTAEIPIATFSSIVGGDIDPGIVLPLRSAGVPFMEGTEFAMRAFRNLSTYHELRKTAQWDDGAQGEEPMPFARPELPSGILPAQTAFRLLESFGLPVIATALARTADEAEEAAGRIGFPVALKVESASIQHKSDAGGVALGLTTPPAVRDAFRDIQRKITAHMPGVEITGMLVQKMASEGLEIILGIKQDPLFGPVIVCGLGGIFVEILRDVSIGIPPLSREQARELVTRLRGWPILAGARGRLPADVDALSDAIVNLSRLALNQRNRIVALDINPLIVYPEGKGVLAVDVLAHFQ